MFRLRNQFLLDFCISHSCWVPTLHVKCEPLYKRGLVGFMLIAGSVGLYNCRRLWTFRTVRLLTFVVAPTTKLYDVNLLRVIACRRYVLPMIVRWKWWLHIMIVKSNCTVLRVLRGFKLSLNTGLMMCSTC